MSQKLIAKDIFGNSFQNLPLVLQKRYANRSHCNDKITVHGALNIHTSLWMKLLSPIMRLCGALVPYAANDTRVTVSFESQPDSNTLRFNRTFNYNNRAPYTFTSDWSPQQDGNLIEFMRFGLGWKMKCHYQNKKVHLDHVGFIWKIGKYQIPLPLHLILGTPYAYETAIDDTHFAMYFEIIHPLFGNVFGYQGTFALEQS